MLKFPHSRVLTLVPILFFITTYELPAVLILGYWLLIQVFSGVGSMAYSQVSEAGVAWFAHIGGFVAGMLLVSVMATHERYRHRREFYW